jgi:hypothetical protein
VPRAHPEAADTHSRKRFVDRALIARPRDDGEIRALLCEDVDKGAGRRVLHVEDGRVDDLARPKNDGQIVDCVDHPNPQSALNE